MEFKQGEKIHLSVLAIDLTASTKLWKGYAAG
jgi:hypothetical protein